MTDFSNYAASTQAVGVLASTFIILSFAQKNDTRFKLMIMAGAATFGLHFFMLGAYLGAAVAIVNVCRTGLSMKFHQSNYLLAFFIIVYITVLVFTYDKPFDLLPVFSSILSTYAMFKLSGLSMRYAFFFSEGAWLLYSIFVKSIGGIITNIFVLGVNTLTTYRLICEKRNVSSADD